MKERDHPDHALELSHPFLPVYNACSRILILGSFPSVQSRRRGFYYGHPQNRFWSVLAAVFSESVPVTIDEKKALLLKHGIALWDVLASCVMRGSADSSITQPIVNDFSPFLAIGIRHIYTTGLKAFQLYNTYGFPQTGIQAVYLPSTSAANRARWPFEKLVEAYRTLIIEYKGCQTALPF